VVSKRLRPMQLRLKHHGPHALRHACATYLLSLGFSMKVIGDFLGHRFLGSTSTYAKVDIAGLRRVADFDLEGVLCSSNMP
jgi:integrase/recombinase XerD